MGFVNYNSNGEKTYSTDSVGTIKYFAATTGIEAGYLDCNGQAVSRTAYSDLFAKIGTAFGVGDGSTTFNVLDFRAASAVGVGTSTKGTQNETVSFAQWDDDKMQKITGQIDMPSYSAFIVEANGSGALSSGGVSSYRGLEYTGSNGIRYLYFDSSNSVGARTGNVTHGKRLGVYIGIKY